MDCEIFECRNCFHAGPLTVHGRCMFCNSDSVISHEVIALLLGKGLECAPDSLVMMRTGNA